MSWYDDAAREVLSNHGSEECDDDCQFDVAAIIVKHDPNRWIPVSERMPEGREFDESGNPTLMVEAFPNKDGEAFIAPFVSGKFLVFSELHDDDWWPLDPQPSHWRPIVLPEVKG